MARKPKEISWEEVEYRMQAGNSGLQIAASMHMDENTFYNRFEDHYGYTYRNYSGIGYSVGNANLQLTQFHKALKGDTKLLIMLGIERLGQGKDENDQIKNLEEKFDESMTQILSLLSSARNMDDSNINNETKS